MSEQSVSPGRKTGKPKQEFEFLEKYREEVNRCFKCGLCRSVCPSFEAIGLEYASPRGRLQFVKSLLEGKVKLDRAVQEHVLDCLLCMRCADTCPAKVRTDKVVLAARAELVRRGRLNIIKKLVFKTVIKSATLLHLGALAASLSQKWFMEPRGFLDTVVPRVVGMEDKAFPRLAEQTATGTLPEVNPARSGHPKMRVAYFIGCGTNLIYPQVARAAVNVLTRNDIEVIIPPGQVCCGIPVYSSGDYENARKLAETNRKVFKDLTVDCVITDCASCSSAFKHDLKDLMGITAFDVPVYDLTEFLATKIELKRDFAPLNLKVTYHDSCHLARGQGIRREPRDLIRMIPGIEFVEMNGADECCGGAGTFAYNHHGLSRQVGAKKAKNIRDTGASLVVTACPSCTMQIADLLAHEGLETGIVHPVELLDRAYRKKDRMEQIDEIEDSSGKTAPDKRGIYA